MAVVNAARISTAGDATLGWGLEYEVSEGWEPLCEFLELAIPDFDFPQLNVKEEIQNSDPQTLDRAYCGIAQARRWKA